MLVMRVSLVLITSSIKHQLPALVSTKRENMPSHASYHSLVSLGTDLEEDDFLTMHIPPARSRPPMFPSLTQK